MQSTSLAQLGSQSSQGNHTAAAQSITTQHFIRVSLTCDPPLQTRRDWLVPLWGDGHLLVPPWGKQSRLNIIFTSFLNTQSETVKMKESYFAHNYNRTVPALSEAHFTLYNIYIKIHIYEAVRMTGEGKKFKSREIGLPLCPRQTWCS